MPLYQKPFVSAEFYLVPALWLEDVSQPRDLDARDLLLFHHVPPTDIIAFQDHPSAFWVRENVEHLPSVMSQPTFRAYRRALLDSARLGGALLALCPEHRECYQLLHWPHFQNKPIYYRPKAYMENRWPVWLGGQWPARVALVGLMVLMVQQPVMEANGVTVEAAVGEIRKAATLALPGVDASRYVRSGLRDLCRLGLVEERDMARRGVTYRLTSAAFTRHPEITHTEIAAKCALDPEADEDWILLIATFLRYNSLLIEDALRVWRKILAYGRWINAPEDARALVAELEKRAGSASTAVTRVLNDFAHRAALEQRRWLAGNQVAVQLTSDLRQSDEMMMPELMGERTRLQATQLLIQYQLSGRISAEEAAAVIEGIAINIWQPPNTVVVTTHLRVNRFTIQTGSRLNCNHLHRGLVDYSQPFRLLVTTRRPDRRVTLRCQSRVMA